MQVASTYNLVNNINTSPYLSSGPMAEPCDTSASLLSGLRTSSQSHRYESCWERFVDRYTPQIYDWCRRSGLGHDQTEEVTQRLMVRLVVSLKTYQYDPSQSFRSWLFVCTRHVIYRYWKEEASRKSRQLADQVELPQKQSLIEMLEEQFDREFEDEARRRVQAQVAQRDWHVFKLLTDSPDSPAAIAAKMELTVDNVYQIKSRIVAALTDEVARLQQSGIPPDEAVR